MFAHHPFGLGCPKPFWLFGFFEMFPSSFLRTYAKLENDMFSANLFCSYSNAAIVNER